jgi:hypothetical protein
MKLRMTTLDLSRTPIEMTIYPKMKVTFDKNGITEVPDRIGEIIIKNNPAYVKVVEDEEPEKKQRKPRTEKAAEEGKSEFLESLK